MKKKITIYDIAKALNITASTVSRALSDHSSISPTTKELVLKTAASMNYEQNKLALALKSGKSNNVGVIVPRIDNTFFSSIIKTIEEELNPFGYHVIICQTNGNQDKEKENIDALLNAQVDGILISTTSNDTVAFERILNKGIPLVFFDRKITMPNVSSVTINDFEGGYAATQHLINTGCTKIAHFSGDTNTEIFMNRFLGYQQALLDNNIEFKDEYVIQTKSSLQDGKKSVKKLLKLENPPHAIFSASDFAALGAIQELKSEGIKIPADFSVIGFSNEPFTKFMELSISTIDQFPLQMGKMTAKIFLDQVNSKAELKIQKNVVLTPELKIRMSSSK